MNGRDEEVDLLRRSPGVEGVRPLPGHRRLLAVPLGELPDWRDGAVIEVDVAPAVLTSVTGRSSGLISWSTGGQAAVLGWDKRGRATLELPGATPSVITADQPLEPGRWARLAAAFTPTSASLWVNTDLVGESAYPSPPSPEGPLLVGTRADTERAEGFFDTEAAAGLVRRARLLSGKAATTWQPAAHDGSEDGRVVTWLNCLTPADHHRPAYHFVPPAHWMNEPHGGIEIDGLHHLFYQANRRGGFWGGIEWGHAVSEDLVRWTHLPPVLTPADSPVAPNGVWSGSSTLDEDGNPVLFVTAGDFSRLPDQSVAVARFDGHRWNADPSPLLEMPTDPGLHLLPNQFRDPFVWRERDSWFMLVGAGIVNRGGTALLYRSHNEVDWELVGPLLTGDPTGQQPGSGDMWELPVLLPVRSPAGLKRHVLMVCTWWEHGSHAQRAEVVYWLGNWDPDAGRFTPTQQSGRLLDLGGHFTGPSGYVTGDRRTILWSIAQDGRSSAKHAESGWAHNAGLPLELSLTDDGELARRPVRELHTLREDLLLDARGTATTDAGARAEIELVSPSAATAASRVDLFVDEAGTPGAVLTVDQHQVELLRPGAATYDVWCPDERTVGAIARKGPCVVRAFLDGSMLEVYVDDTLCLTTRVYAGPDSCGLRFRGQAADRMRVWRLAAAQPETQPSPTTRMRGRL